MSYLLAEVNHIITSAMLYTYFEFRFNCATLLQTRYTLWQLYVCLSVGRSVGLSVRPSTRPWQRDACIVSNWLNTLPNFFTIQQPDPWTPLLIRYRRVYMHTSYHRPRSSRLRNRFGLCVCVYVSAGLLQKESTDLNPLHVGIDPEDIQIQINPEVRIWISDHF